jgi:hypothetical protein
MTEANVVCWRVCNVMPGVLELRRGGADSFVLAWVSVKATCAVDRRLCSSLVEHCFAALCPMCVFLPYDTGQMPVPVVSHNVVCVCGGGGVRCEISMLGSSPTGLALGFFFVCVRCIRAC